MTRFTLRDVFWLTLVAGLGVGWWRDHQREQAERDDISAAILSDPEILYRISAALNDFPKNGALRNFDWEFKKDGTGKFRLVRNPRR